MTYEIKETLLQVNNVSKSYDVPILENVSFEIKNITRPNIHQGQIVSLIGKSGSGKSTLFRILAGLEEPTSGRVQVKNMDTHEYQDVKEGDMGVVFQNSYIFPWRRVEDILDMAASANPKMKENKKELIEHYVEIFSLSEHIKKYSKNLSGGQKQRVSIARALIKNPDMVILDDCLSAVDVETEHQILQYLNSALAGKTAIIITHRVHSLQDFDQIIVLEEGKIAEMGTHEQLANSGGFYAQQLENSRSATEYAVQVEK